MEPTVTVMDRKLSWRAINIGNCFLSLVFLFLLASYHSLNLWEGGHYKIWSPNRSSLEIRAFGRKWTATLLTQKNSVLGEPVDIASKKIGGLGYVFKYLARQWPESIFASGHHQDSEWIFLRSEIVFQFPAVNTEVNKRLVPQVKKFVQYYSSRGVTAIVLPIPTKISIERKRLSSRLPPETWWQPFPITHTPEDSFGAYRLLTEISRHHIVDLYSAFQKHRSSTADQQLYAPQDSHWTSFGISIALQEVISLMQREGWKIKSPVFSTFGPDTLGPLDYDFWLQLQLPRYFTASWFTWHEPLYRVNEAAQPREGRLILAGTSYAARLAATPFGFGPQLANHLRRNLLDFAQPHFGAGGSFRLMQENNLLLQKGDILIWEVPLRELFSPGEDVTLLSVLK